MHAHLFFFSVLLGRLVFIIVGKFGTINAGGDSTRVACFVSLTCYIIQFHVRCVLPCINRLTTGTGSQGSLLPDLVL